MKVFFHKKFKKQFKKLPEDIQVKFFERLGILVSYPRSSILNVHLLKGSMSNLTSMNVTGDYRAIFVEKKDKIEFHMIGTHSNLY
jgi:mRNA-degrading endonuclease YafQ of YafQ-DinJ toxin-antitoxin module